jgi:hypothetical protein
MSICVVVMRPNPHFDEWTREIQLHRNADAAAVSSLRRALTIYAQHPIRTRSGGCRTNRSRCIHIQNRRCDAGIIPGELHLHATG